MKKYHSNEFVSEASLLIVDDSPANLQLLSGMLKQTGFKVRPAPSGETALQAARSFPPDLILLDINMPGMNGYEVCEQLKADENLKDIPVIFISALNETIDKVKAFNVGGVDYVTKPFQFEEVEARVCTHLALRKQEKELRKSFARLQELEQLRDSLVHMIIHDMNSPLLVIRMSVDMLKNKTADPQYEVQLMNSLQSATNSLSDMVAQLLDISRLESGQMPLKKQEQDLVQTIKSKMEALKPAADARQLSLTSPSSCMAVFDSDLISRVIANLISNAFKFTVKTGEIKLTVEEMPDQIKILVNDNGRGISPENHKLIFEKFGQVEMRQKRVGTGLGLTFCKLAVEAHGGSIGVDSQLGQGATFWFTLPRS